MTVATAAIIGLGTAAVSAGAGMIAANQQKKAAQGAAGAAQKQFLSTGNRASSMLDKYRALLSDPSRMLALTMNANNQNREEAQAQSIRLNNFNTAQLHGAINKSLPGYQNLINKALGNTRSWIKGQLPEDVAAYVEDRAAEKATRFGLPADSVTRKALTARDLGRTSLDLMSQGENSMQRWISTARSFLTPTLSSPMDFLLTPQQYTNTILAASDIAGKQASILSGAGNNATTAYLQGAEASIKAEAAQAKALMQGLETMGGTGMAYAMRNTPGTTSVSPTGAVTGQSGAARAGSNMMAILAAMNTGGQPTPNAFSFGNLN